MKTRPPHLIQWWFSIGLLLLCAPNGMRAAEPLAASKTNAIPLEVGVDARVELICIIFRLAGNPEYQRGKVNSYIKDIEQHFEPVREHAVIKLVRQLRATRGVGFDAPMSLAIHLKDLESLAERLPWDPRPPNLDNRWQPAETKKFLAEARKFAHEAKFAEFVAAHKELYAETNRRARQLLEREGRLDWFGRFFGARPGAQFRMVPALVNGGSNYGPQIKTDTGEELYCILGVWHTDTKGLPVFDREVLDTVAHEFCHSYVNPHVYARTKELAAAGQRLFEPVRERMQRMAYGNWQTMLHESIVRASVVRYLDATQGRAAAARQVLQEQNRGFAWTLELAQLLEKYEAQRDQYPDFAAFMPRIVEFFNQYKISSAVPSPAKAAAADAFQTDFKVYWPPDLATNPPSGKARPLLHGKLFGAVAGNKIALNVTLARPADDLHRRFWNSSLAFPQHEWMARVRVYDQGEQWLWPNLAYLLKLDGKEREERYGGWDPGKQIDNDFAAVLIRKYDADGRQESADTRNAPLVSARWQPMGAKNPDKTAIVHEARSDQFVAQLFDDLDQPAQGRLKVWLIYADFMDYPAPKPWPSEREFNGGILAFFLVDWKHVPGQPAVAQCANTVPDVPTGFDWQKWVGRETQASHPKASARLRNF